MPAVGGSVESITLSGRYFSVAADGDLNRMLGGDVNQVEANGDRTGRIIKEATPWNVSDCQVSIDNSREDQEYLQGLADRNSFFVIVVTFADGAAYSGEGTIVDTIGYSSQNTTATIALAGPDKLTKQ